MDNNLDMYRTFVAVMIRQFCESDRVVLSREVYEELGGILQLEIHTMDDGDIEVRLIEI